MRDRRSWFVDQGWSDEGLEFGKLERKAQHATERSEVECGACSGGFPNSAHRGWSRGFRGFDGRLIDMGWSQIAEALVGPPVVVADEPFI